MTALPLAGPSGQLRGKAESRRVVNWMPVQTETNTGKGGQGAYLKQCPGLRYLCNLGYPVAGLKAANGVLYAMAGSQLVEVSASFGQTVRGTMGTGVPSFGVNQTQLNVVCGNASYVYDFATHVITKVLTNWQGSALVSVLDGYGVYSQAGTRQFYISGNEDFTALNVLQFASAEGSTGNIVGHIEQHRQIVFLKETTGEVWYDDPNAGADFPLARNSSATIEVGCAAAHTLHKIGGVAYWLGADENGQGVVFGMAGYVPQRVSHHALEELLAALPDLSQAVAWVYHQEGLTFYVLNVPGLATTWVYEVSAGTWHERADWDTTNGQFVPWRANCHAVAYGMHIVGDSLGNLYELSPLKSSNYTGPLVRDFISPHNATAELAVTRFGSLQLDCETGQGLSDGSQGQVMLRYSNDGGANWSNWRYLTLGVVGATLARARATMLGISRDRVWHLRVTDDVLVNPLAVVINAV